MNTQAELHTSEPLTISKKAIALLLLGSFVIALIIAEVGLRIAGFSYRLYPEKLEFGYPDFKTMESNYIPDPDLFWTPKDYPQRIANLKGAPPDIVFMGDSCTEFGTYDKAFNKLFRKTYPDAKLSAVKIGVAGWASYQGRRQMERDVVQVRPKIATIYYGWNDHWIGFGIEDKDVAKLHSPFWSTLERLRLVQLGVKAFLSFGKKDRSQVPMRVAVEDYRKNLIAIADTAAAHGITPVFITAPTSQRKGNEPQYLKGRFVTNLDDLVPLHQRYLTQVREVAALKGVPLCDLYSDFAALPQRDVELVYFKNSGIHLTPQGNKKIGEFLFSCFQRQHLLDPFIANSPASGAAN